MSNMYRAFFLEGKDFLDTEESAHFMSMSRSKFYNIVQDGLLKPVKAHGMVLFRKSELLESIESQIRMDQKQSKSYVKALTNFEKAKASLKTVKKKKAVKKKARKKRAYGNG